MTVIAACRDEDGAIWMGCDAIGISRNSDVRLNARSKIFRLGEMLIGSSGGTRQGQIVEYMTTMPPIPSECDLSRWLVQEFVPALRGALKSCGGETKDQQGDPVIDGRLLLGLRGSIFEVDSAYGVMDQKTTYHAIGSADQEALAGMFVAVQLQPNMHARAVVLCGLEAAAAFNVAIRPPFEIMCDLHENVARLQALG